MVLYYPGVGRIDCNVQLGIGERERENSFGLCVCVAFLEVYIIRLDFNPKIGFFF